MATYFKPLRRKIGVVTLWLACLFAAGWVRSRFSEDRIIWRSNALVTFVVSLDSTIMFWVGIYDEPFPYRTWPVFETRGFRSFEQVSQFMEWRYNLVDIRIARYKSSPPVTGYVAALPYYLLVVPLTLISVWLLLSKQRLAKPTGE